MNKLIQIWVPFLVIALSFVLYSEFSSVERVTLDPVYGDRQASQPLRQPQAARQPTRQVARKVASRLAVGQRYNSLEQLVADQRAAGFVRIGYFGKHWPATVTEIATDQDEIKFVRQGGTPHHYTKFDGYEMKMVRLMAGKQDTIVVFRGTLKKR
jgi:hypothetical protein